MVEIAYNETRQLLRLAFLDRVTVHDMQTGLEGLRSTLVDVPPGFQLLADLTELELMDLATAPHVTAAMDLLREKGVGRIVRVIPDPRKDIGFAIMSRFHYDPALQITTFETRDEAMEYLGL